MYFRSFFYTSSYTVALGRNISLHDRRAIGRDEVQRRHVGDRRGGSSRTSIPKLMICSVLDKEGCRLRRSRRGSGSEEGRRGGRYIYTISSTITLARYSLQEEEVPAEAVLAAERPPPAQSWAPELEQELEPEC